MKLPTKLNRRAIRLNFTRLSEATWDYLFDHEKENGLGECRTKGWGVKHAWYETAALMLWLVDHGYYAMEDFKPAATPSTSGPWGILPIRKHAMSA